MTDTTEVNVGDFAGKMARIAYTKDGESVDIEARIEQATPFAIVVREKGQRGAAALKLINTADIQDILEIPDPPRQLKTKKLSPVTQATVRRHMLDAHYCSLAYVNSVTDADALKWHNEQDHDGMGHNHTRGVDDEDDVTDGTDGTENDDDENENDDED